VVKWLKRLWLEGVKAMYKAMRFIGLVVQCCFIADLASSIGSRRSPTTSFVGYAFGTSLSAFSYPLKNDAKTMQIDAS